MFRRSAMIKGSRPDSGDGEEMIIQELARLQVTITRTRAPAAHCTYRTWTLSMRDRSSQMDSASATQASLSITVKVNEATRRTEQMGPHFSSRHIVMAVGARRKAAKKAVIQTHRHAWP